MKRYQKEIERLKKKMVNQFDKEFRKNILPLLQAEEKAIKKIHPKLRYVIIGNGTAIFEGEAYNHSIEDYREFDGITGHVDQQERINEFLNVLSELQYSELSPSFKNNKLK